MAYNSSKGTFDVQHISASSEIFSRSALTTEGNLNISGSTALGDNKADVITITGQLTGSQGAYFADRVGVGVATPDSALEVAGNIHLSSETTTPSTPAAADGGVMYVKADGNLYWLSDDVAEVSLSSGGGGGISWDGSTANGVATFKDADEATVEANLTFDGSTLTVTGDSTIDKNHSDTADATITGLQVDFDKTGASTGDNTMYGIQIDMDNTTATNGTNYMYGLHVTPTLTHAADAGMPVVYGALINAQGGANGSSLVQGARIEAGGGDINYGIQLDVEDGGVDLRIESSADSGDYFQIQTTTHGATTITTKDDDATAAHLTFTVDGDITLDPAAGNVAVDGILSASAQVKALNVVAGGVNIISKTAAIQNATSISGSGDVSGFNADFEGAVDGLGGFKVNNTSVVSSGRLIENVLGATIGGPLTTTGEVSGSGLTTIVGGIVNEGNLDVSGSTTLGNAATDVTTVTGRLTGSQGGYFGGRVGINQNVPAWDLDLSGTLHLNGNLGAPSAPPATEGGVLFGSGSGTLYWASAEQMSRDISNQVFHKPQGCTFSRASAATVALTPGGLDGNARVSLYKDTTKHMMEYVLTASITADISVSGFNGLDTGTEAADTGYYMYVICKDQGLLPGMLFSTSNINPTMPSGYTYRSAPIWFVSNDNSSDLLDFNQRGCNGTCYYNNFQNVIDNGQQLQASGWAAVDMSEFIPADSEALLLMRISGDVTAGSTTVRLTTDNGAAPAAGIGTYFVGRLSSNGDVATSTWFNWGLSNSASGLYYAWTADPGSADQGLRIDVAGFKLW